MADPILTVLGEVGRVSGTRVGRYTCILYGLQEQAIAQSEITGYPRWAEPAALLLSRAINTALHEGQDCPCPGHAVDYLVDVQLNETPLFSMDMVLSGGQLILDDGRHFPVPAAPAGLWRLAQIGLCLHATGQTDLPPWPRELEPKIYDFNGMKYCRASELPSEARVVFEHRYEGTTVPFVPIVDDAYKPGDVYDFLEGSFPVIGFSSSTSAGNSQMDNYGTVVATVITVASELKHACVEAADGNQYAINATTHGVHWKKLELGQKVGCVVTKGLTPRVVEAKIVI